jgi:RNA polymerase-interacting CarD/CdnL/TRCF family regulator
MPAHSRAGIFLSLPFESKEVFMNFQTGDTVMHSTYGLGQVQAIEERTVDNVTTLYYMVQTANLTLWVPADENMKNRLHYPTGESKFRKTLTILSSPAEPLPDDRRRRNIQLLDLLNDGGVESLCKVIRDLTAFRHSHSWNDYDGALMKRAIKTLVGEWSVSLSVSLHEAEMELHRLLEPEQKRG